MRLQGGTVPTGQNWFESLVGENTRPDTKLHHFEQALEQLASAPVDMALLKFCYLDFDADTDLTVDGGHLNEAGSRAVARELIRVLAAVLLARTQSQAGLVHPSPGHPRALQVL